MSINRARALRRAMPEAERRLWSLLRRKQLSGFRFRRQHPVPPHFLDFYCYAEKVAIELDGSQHGGDRAVRYDEARGDFLRAQGIRVIRFWNDDVFKNPDMVIDTIFRALIEPLEGRF